jgi:tetratricopeptide (TPR) repeat protein
VELGRDNNPVHELLINAGSFQQEGNFQEAIECYQAALKVEPMNADIYDAMGLTMLRLGENKIAKDLFLTSTSLNTQSSSSFRNLGLAHYSLDERQSAIDAFKKSIECDGNNVDALLNIGQIYSYAKDYDAAKQYFRKANLSDKNNPEPLCELSEANIKQGEYDAAIKNAKAALQIRPNSIKPLRSLSNAYRLQSNNRLSVKYAFDLVNLNPSESQNYVELVKSLLSQGGTETGLKYAEKAIQLNPENPDAYSCMSLVLSRTGDWHEALENMNKAVELAPDNEDLIGQKAGVLHRLGHNKEAYELALPLVSNRTSFSSNSLEVLSRIAGDYGKEKEIVQLLDRVLANRNLASGVRSQLSFSTGQLYDKIGNYKKAFNYIKEGNKLRNIKYDPKNDIKKFGEIREVFTKESFKKFKKSTVHTEKPIFIVGMPRSGTSLTEKILASHSQVFGANELTEIRDICQNLSNTVNKGYPAIAGDLTQQEVTQAAEKYLEFINSLDTGDHMRITDKMPQNFAYIGIISMMFPDSPIIHCNRDPMDTCVSCYYQNFAAATSGMAFSFDLTSLGQYYRLYQDVMAHWREVLPGRVYDIHYESLVSNPQPEIEKLLKHCNLEWEDACMEHNKSTHITTTASYDQVRQPINTKSVERWKRYGKELNRLKASLKIN